MPYGFWGRLRFCLISERLRLASRRRLFAPLLGRVGLRGIGGTIASRRMLASRSRAAIRLRCWERCSDALIVSTVPVRRSARKASARRRCTSLSAIVVPMSKLSWTRESVVLTDWPPGPEERENCSTSSAAAMVRPFGAPGPGSICRSSMSLHHQKLENRGQHESAGRHRQYTARERGSC